MFALIFSVFRVIRHNSNFLCGQPNVMILKFVGMNHEYSFYSLEITPFLLPMVVKSGKLLEEELP